MAMSGTLRTNKGFTLVEMIIVMAIFVVVIAITGSAFNRIASQALSLTKTAESNIAGIVGLDSMRADIESAGYGLPWSFSQAITYSEAAVAPGTTLNDNGSVYASDPTQNNVPRAIMSTNNVVSTDPAVVFNGSDVLTVRSQSVATDVASKQWTYIESAVRPNTNPNPDKHHWSADNLADTAKVVLINPIANLQPTNQLVVNSSTGAWTAPFDNYSTIGKPPIYNDAEKKSDAFIIYGVDDSTDLRMPFNRADFYVRRPATSEESWARLPQRCNTSSGILFKGLVRQSDGVYDELPLLDCVLDMQVVYELRTAGSNLSTNSDVLNTQPPDTVRSLTPKEVREQVKAIKVYILTHDGGRDRNYTFPTPTIRVGPGDGTGRTYDFAANGIPDWQNYRWRVYQIVASPRNLIGNISR
ncbi:MAG: prepilin-type N-terminal cleavage/methylation domain-containing protein [Desulfuromonadaceae bacterium]|nr:prepilin-type N-terminal cleavage/methylation domain-containing protein [Desulfuromonadaceae bacterium]